MTSAPPAPVSPSRAWWTVAAFCLLFALSMLDRMILIVLSRPMATSLSMTDEQSGMLFGTSFAAVYTLGGLVIARMLDRGNRKRLVVIGVLIWSLSTMASAWAGSFPLLLILRSGVAIGEAVLSPAAISIFADLFRPARRGLPTSLYVAFGTVMVPGAFVVGAAMLGAATDLASATGLEPWRLTLIAVGLPGVLFALVVQLTVREPRRTEHAPATKIAVADTGFFGDQRRFWLMVAAMHATSAIAFNGWLAWTSTVLSRRFGMTAAEAGHAFGQVGLTGSIAAVLCWPLFDMVLSRALGRSGAALLYAFATVIVSAMIVVVGTSASVSLILLLSGLTMFFISGIVILPNLMIQAAAPATSRARLAALVILANGLVGVGLGPLLTASIAGRLLSHHDLGQGMSVIAVATVPVLLLLGIAVQRPYARLLR